MKKLLVAITIIAFSVNLNAQNRAGYNNEEMKIKKTAFISKALNMSDKKSEVFWPLYNNFQEQMQQINTSKRKATFDIKKTYESSSEEELEAIFATMQALDEKEYRTKADYNVSLSKMLTAKERALLFMAEFNFKREKNKRPTKTKENNSIEGK